MYSQPSGPRSGVTAHKVTDPEVRARIAELFSDPQASLDRIAGSPPPGPRVDPAAALRGYGDVGPSADEAFRDPFGPLGSDTIGRTGMCS